MQRNLKHAHGDARIAEISLLDALLEDRHALSGGSTTNTRSKPRESATDDYDVGGFGIPHHPNPIISCSSSRRREQLKLHGSRAARLFVVAIGRLYSTGRLHDSGLTSYSGKATRFRQANVLASIGVLTIEAPSPYGRAVGVKMNKVGLSEEQIIARIERLPISAWYARILATVAAAHFFDAFDSLTIAFILPVLVGLWKITPGEIGLLISAGFAGQLLGALTLGWAAEKYGRQRVLQFSLLIMAAFAAACALAWSYTSLLVFRVLQGVGLGGEVPVAATYLNEFTRAPYRGRFLLLLQWMFAIGVAVTSLVATWLVPNFGWQSMFWLGILPALLAIGLRWLIPELPRWLAGQGRLDEADAALSTIEASVPDAKQAPLPSDVPAVVHQRAGWADLFKGIYRQRTFCAWTIAFCTSFIGYGLITWLPTIFRTVYQLPIAQALQYGLIINTVGLAGPL